MLIPQLYRKPRTIPPITATSAGCCPYCHAPGYRAPGPCRICAVAGYASETPPGYRGLRKRIAEAQNQENLRLDAQFEENLDLDQEEEIGEIDIDDTSESDNEGEAYAAF